jgi:endonuclease/exonuclease/phosphatase (EEP) superfamily protein YafD
VHFAAAFLAFAVALAVLRSRSWALASAAVAALALAPVAPWYFATAASAADATQPSMKLLVSNVDVANHQHKRLLQRIAEENPDVVGSSR